MSELITRLAARLSLSRLTESSVRAFKRSRRPAAALLIVILALTWVFSGWPQVLDFPPKVQEARAAPLPSRWFGSFGSLTSTSTTQFISPFGGIAPGNNEASSHHIAPAAGTVQNLEVRLDTAPGAGTSYQFTFRQELADTALTCTVSDTDTTCSDASSTVAISAGDRLSVEVTPTGGPQPTRVSFVLEFIPTVEGDTVLMGTSGGNFSPGTGYSPFVGGTFSASESSVRVVIPIAGTLKDLYVRLSAAPDTDNSRTFTLRKNATSTPLTVTYGSADSGLLSSTSTVSVAAGDTITMQKTETGTPALASAAWGVVFVPDNPGDFVIPANSSAILSTSAVTYFGLSGSTQSSTEAVVQTLGSSGYMITGAYAVLTAAPLQSYSMALRQDEANATTTFAMTISGLNTTSSVTGESFTPLEGALYATAVTPSNTPQSVRLAISYVGNVDDADITPPTVQTLSPADNATSTSPTANLIITFNENVVASSTGDITIHESVGDALVETISADTTSTVSIASTTVTINPDTVLDDVTGYYVLIDAGAFEDESGNSYAGISATSTWNFTTGDTTPPVPGSSGTITTTNVATSTLTLNWTKASDAVTASSSLEYEVRRSTSSNIDTVSNVETNGTIVQAYTADIDTFSVTGLNASTTYYFNVIVKDEQENKAAYTMVSTTTQAVAGTTYYVDETNASSSDGNAGTDPDLPFASIGQCATVLVAGDTCIVAIGGTYDERVSESTDGSSGSRITYIAESGSPRPKVRGFAVAGDYVAIDGFELTNIGMSADTNPNISISGTTGVQILNNYIHDTNSSCIRYGSSNFDEIRGNDISYCGVAEAITGNATGTYNISTGVNDAMQFSLNGGASQPVTLTAGSARTITQICADIEGSTTGIDCRTEAADGHVHIQPVTVGAGTSVVLQNIANDAYATLGVTVGGETSVGHGIALVGVFGQSSVDTLIEDNTISHVADYLNPAGTPSRLVFRNNTMGPADDGSAYHIDGIQPNATTTFGLMEGNISVDNANSDNHFFLNQLEDSDNWIIRYNLTNRSNGGFDWRNADNHHLYNNTFYDNYAYSVSNFQILMTSSLDNVARNNIWYRSVSPGGNPYAFGNGTSTIDKDYDLYFDQGSPQEDNAVNADPSFTDADNDDFTLQGGSPAIDAGGPLTTVSSTDSGTGAELIVGNALLFQDGWAGVDPDWIAVGNATNTVQISSIDYDTNTITLAGSVSRSEDDPVYLFKKSDGVQVLYGSAPDIGAYEFTEDVTAPTVESLSPLDNATGVSTSTNLTITFSEPVVASSTGDITIHESVGDALVETISANTTSTVSISGDTVTINPTGVLDFSTGYYILIDAGAFEDAAGNPYAGIAATSTWNFTNGADTTLPVISSVSSAPAATSSVITWTTDEAASTQVAYGVIGTFGSLTTETNTSTRVTSHEATLAPLLACTKYFYQVRSRDAVLNLATSSATFTTTGCTGSASVESDTTEEVASSTGATVELLASGKGLRLSIPADYATSTAVFQIKKMNKTASLNSTGLPSGREAVGDHVYDLRALTDAENAITSFDEAITVTLLYSASDVSGFDESTLRIYRHDGSSWNELSGCSVDTGAKSVTCTTTAFSTFSIFGQPSSGSAITYGVGTGDALNYLDSAYLATQSPPASSPTQTPGDTNATIREQLNSLIATLTSLLVQAAAAGVPISQSALDVFAGAPPTSRFTRNLTVGDTGEDVRTLQRFLNNNGFILATTGPGSPGNETTRFGALTKTALARFQAARGVVPASGYFGPLTRAKVAELQGTGTPIQTVSFTRNLTLGDTGEDVRELQRFLNKQGFLVAQSGPGSPGNETVMFGYAAQAALARFQQAKGITPAVGYFGPVTREHVRSVSE